MPEQPIVTYTGINPPSVRDKLVAAMAICTQPERVERHQLYDIINPQSHVVAGYIELLVETSRITLIYHPLEAPKPNAEDKPAESAPADPKAALAQAKPTAAIGPNGEIKIGVSDFDQADAILRAMGMHARSFEETKREIWSLENATVTVDTWPWLDPFVTISAPDQAGIEKAAAAVGLNANQKFEGAVAKLYAERYSIDESVFFNTPKLMFMVRPDWIKWDNRLEPSEDDVAELVNKPATDATSAHAAAAGPPTSAPAPEAAPVPKAAPAANPPAPPASTPPASPPTSTETPNDSSGNRS